MSINMTPGSSPDTNTNMASSSSVDKQQMPRTPLASCPPGAAQMDTNMASSSSADQQRKPRTPLVSWPPGAAQTMEAFLGGPVQKMNHSPSQTSVTAQRQGNCVAGQGQAPDCCTPPCQPYSATACCVPHPLQPPPTPPLSSSLAPPLSPCLHHSAPPSFPPLRPIFDRQSGIACVT